MNRQLTDLQLERYLAQAVSPEERATMEKLLEGSEADAEALRLLRAESEALLVSRPPAAFAQRVMPPRRSPWKRWLGGLGALGAAAAAATIALVVSQMEPAQDDARTKGGVSWSVTASGPRPRLVQERSIVAPKETLSFQVASERPLYVAIISHAPDGWWVYAPAARKQALHVERGRTLLPQGAQLDDTEGEETLHLLSSQEPFEPERVREELARGSRPPGVDIEELSFIKRRQ